MKYSSDILSIICNNDLPVFECDCEFNILAVNSYIQNNQIHLAVGDNLFHLSTLNHSLLNAAKNNLFKGLPFFSTNFNFNLSNSSIFFIPCVDSDDTLKSILCYLIVEPSHQNLLKSDALPQNIYAQFHLPIIHIMNTLTPLACKLEAMEQYNELSHINEIANQCYRMLRVSNTVNTYYQLINNQAVFHTKKLSFNYYLDHLIKSLQVMLTSADYQILLDLCDEPILIDCDEEYLSIALFHLISNSCLYSSKGSLIRINLSQNNGFAQLTISDEGIGISKADLNHVFEPFFTKNSQSFAHTDKLGLGLPTAKKIVELFNGTIFIASEENKGTTIAISFPIAEANTALILNSDMTRYVTNKFSDMYLYFSEICQLTLY